MRSTCKSMVCLLAFVITWHAGAQTTNFSAAQIRQDLQYLRSGLKASHPNLYLYSQAQELDAFFDSLMQQLPPEMSASEAYVLLTPVCSIIKDGHTLIFPAGSETEYHNRESGFFPFKIYWKDQRMYVELNYTREIEIADGTEILEINGARVPDIMTFILTRMMRDGYNQTYPVWVLNNWFNEYYSYFYGHPGTFELKCRMSDGSVETKKIPALKKQDMFANRVRNYPQRLFEKRPGEGITLEINDSLKTAILVIRDFHKQVLKKVYKQDFGKTLRHYFARIQASGVAHLVLDIRNNQGGDIENGKILLAYLMSEPFSLVSAYFKVKNPAATADTRIGKCKGPSLGVHKPKTDAFKGKLYVLINGGSFSNSGIVSSALQHYKRAVFIGEESGGNRDIIAGDVKYKQLPNTKIKVEIPTLQFLLRQNEGHLGKGVIPDYWLNPSVEDLIKGRDIEKNFALELIKKSR